MTGGIRRLRLHPGTEGLSTPGAAWDAAGREDVPHPRATGPQRRPFFTSSYDGRPSGIAFHRLIRTLKSRTPNRPVPQPHEKCPGTRGALQSKGFGPSAGRLPRSLGPSLRQGLPEQASPSMGRYGVGPWTSTLRHRAPGGHVGGAVISRPCKACAPGNSHVAVFVLVAVTRSLDVPTRRH